MMWQNTKIEFLSFSKIINHFRCVNFYVFISSENRTEKIIAIPSNCAYFYTIASDNIKAVDHKIISTCLYNFSWERKNQMGSVTISEKQKMMRREREKKRESKKICIHQPPSWSGGKMFTSQLSKVCVCCVNTGP